MKTKKILALVLVAVMLLALCIGCKKADADTGSSGGGSSSSGGGSSSSGGGSSSSGGGSSAGGSGASTPPAGSADETGTFVLKQSDIQETGKKAYEQAKAGKQVDHVIAVNGSSSYDPAPFGGTGGHEAIQPLLYANLCAMPDYASKLEDLQMWLAKSVDYNKDTKLLKVELWDYITDNQGHKITAEDVEYCYLYTRDEAATCQGCSSVSNDLASIKVVDDYHIEFQLKETIGPGAVEDFLTIVEIVDSDWHKNASADDKTTNPACTGAYYIKEIQVGANIVYEAWDYWQKDVSLRPNQALQNVKTIYYNVISEAAMRVIAMENGEVDYSPIDATNIYRFFDVETEESKPGYTVLYRFGNHNRELMYNNDTGVTSGINSVFNNQKLRQAFSTAIDCYQAAIGFGNTETSFVLVNDTGMPGAQDWLDKWYEESWYEYDVDEALRLLQESGHSKDEGLTVRLLTNGSTVNLAGCAVYQAFWADIGVTTDILGYDQALFNTYKFNSAEWDLINDVKPNGFGICPIGWNDIFDPTAYENGGACFTHDDHLVELLKAANMIHDEASVDAFHQYQMTMNYEYPISCSYSYYVAQDGITGIWLTCNAYKNFPVWGSFTYADDFKSVG